MAADAEHHGCRRRHLHYDRLMAGELPISDVPFTHDPWVAARERYDTMPYRRVGTSGLLLPAISLGLWYNFGDNRPFDGQREILRYAFDHGITHFDLANNYGPPYGSAEENFGRMLRRDFKPYRNELIISTKAGWDMWPGPYGQLGGRAYLLASLDESLDRLGLDYAGMGAIPFTALAQGLLTDRYLQRPAADIDRATTRPTFDDKLVTERVRERLRGLAGIAERRGQSLAQLALAWVLR